MITNITPEPVLQIENFNRMMDRMFGHWPFENRQRTWVPAVDVKETEKDYQFLVELPGMKLEDVDVRIQRDTLIISGKREINLEEKRDEYVRVERGYGAFERMFGLGGLVDPTKVDAKFKDGVLTVKVVKNLVEQPHKVKIAPA